MFAILGRDNVWWFMGLHRGYPLFSREKEKAATFEKDEVDSAAQVLREYGVPCRGVELK